MSTIAKKKVAILGGGVGAMTTAAKLTENPNWHEEFESITVYQLGWRIGGKGASGRQAHTCAIEEHGLHVWLGFYENAFKLIRAAYTELNRPESAPLATWDKAFKPRSYVGVEQHENDGWQPWMFEFPKNSSLPGEGGELPSLWDYFIMLSGWLKQTAHKARPTYQTDKKHSHHDIVHWLESLGEKIELGVGITGYEIGAELYALLAHEAEKMHVGDQHHDHRGMKRLLTILEHLGHWLGRELAKLTARHMEERRVLLLLDMGATTMLGLIRANIWTKADGLDHLDDDFCAWLSANGAMRITTDIKQNPLLRGLYDFVFAYENGEFEKPNFSTGPALRTIFRMCFTYKGSIFWKMQAGMGDTIFTPFYQVLKARGVKFEFFHRVHNLGLSEDGTGVETITMGRQVTLKKDEYDPLINCIDLPCWPNEPIYEQIVEGDDLQRKKINLESFWTPWEEVETFDLQRGKNFDVVVFGISLGSIPYICPELLAQSEAWQNMVDKVGTVRTMALQLWLNGDLKRLGWEQASPILTGYAEPFDTWADMSDLLVREHWVGNNSPKGIHYFCNAMPGGIDKPGDIDAPKRARAQLEAGVNDFLSQDIHALWPDASEQGSDALDPRLIVSRYIRANIDPSERYAMSLSGSTQYRLRANDSGFNNLYLTGDWIRNDFNAGCVEAAVMGGMQCANAILGRPLKQGIIG